MLSTGSSISSFVNYQRKEYGGRWEVQEGLWAVFAVPTGEEAQLKLARELLGDAPFPYHTGESEDDDWRLYYVETPHKQAAIAWLDELHAELAGEIKLPTAAQRKLIRELEESSMPHRVAQRLSLQHEEGRLTAGAIREPDEVRAVLDRLHAREHLYWAAFLKLLESRLIDLLTLHRKLIAEDIELLNSLIQGSVSQDPFFNNRQNSAAAIRKLLVECEIINSLDQQKNNAVRNPYTRLTDIRVEGDEAVLRSEGMEKRIGRERVIEAIRDMRRALYAGQDPADVTTRAPWNADASVSPTRVIKAHFAAHPETSALDWLYMFERACTPVS